MTFLKKTILVSATFVALIVFFLSLSTFFIKPDFIKERVDRELHLLTGQQTHIKGNCTWQLFPRPGIKITDLDSGQPFTETMPYFFKLKNLVFNLKITPLFRGQLLFNKIEAEDLELTINQFASHTLPTTPLHPLEAQPLAITFALNDFLLKNGRIIINFPHQQLRIIQLQLAAEDFNLTQLFFPLQFKAKLELSEPNKLLLKTLVNFQGQVAVSSAKLTTMEEILQKTRLKGQLTLQRTRLFPFIINKINSRVTLQKGLLQLSPLTLNLYNGESIGDFDYNLKNQAFNLNQNASHIDSNLLTLALFNKNIVNGYADFSLHAQGQLDTTNWQERSSAYGSLIINNGLIENFNIEKLVSDSSSKIIQLLEAKKDKTTVSLNSQPAALPSSFKDSTKFTLLSIQYHLQNQLLKAKSFILQTQALQLKGTGELNLETKTLNSQLLAKVLADKNNETAEQLLGGSFPLVVNGNLETPLIAPDLNTINSILSKLWVKDTLIMPVKQIHQQLKSALNPRNKKSVK